MVANFQKDEVYDRVTSIFSDMLKINKDRIKQDSKLGEDLGIDSVDFFDIVICLHRAFDLKIADQQGELPEMETVADVVNFIQEKIANSKNR